MDKQEKLLAIARLKRELSVNFVDKQQVIEFLCNQLMEIANSTPTTSTPSTVDWYEEWLLTAICSE